MKPGALVHRKMVELADWLAEHDEPVEPLTVAAGMLERLWIAVAQQADDGDLSGWTDRQIARCTGWRGDPSELVTVLVSAGWLDGEEGSRSVHGWDEHAPGYVRDKMRKRTERGGMSGTVRDSPGQSGKVTEKVRPPLRTAPLPTASLPDPDTPALSTEPKARASSSTPYPPGFLRAWTAYPHHEQRSRKAAAAKVWGRLRLEAQVEDVLRWIASGTCSDDWRRDGGQYVPGMQAWLAGRDFAEPPPEPPPPETRLSEAGRTTAEAGARWVERQRARDAAAT